MNGAYSCPRHGVHSEPAHKCPVCIAGAVSLVKSLDRHAMTGQLSNFGDLLGSLLPPLLPGLLTGLTVGGKIPEVRSSPVPETDQPQTEQDQGDRRSEKGGSSC